MQAVTVKLAPRTLHRIDSLARRRGVSRSQVIRDAIEGLGAAEGASCLELAGSLAGSLAGPGTLLSDPHAMEDYGQ